MLLTGIGLGYAIATGSALWELAHDFKTMSASIHSSSSSRPTPALTAVKVRVLAKQFSWHFHYPGPDGVFGASDPFNQSTEKNPLGLDFKDPAAADDLYSTELVLPCSVEAGIFLTSADVIHALGHLEGTYQEDADPGRYNETFLRTPTLPRTGTLRCVQLCGADYEHHHSPYRFVLQADFDLWLAGLKPITEGHKSPPSVTGPAEQSLK